MHSLQNIIRLFVIASCLFAVGASCTQAEEQKKSPATSSSDMNPMMGMMNPHMTNPMMGSGMMNPMMGSGMMNPMMGSGMMNPMMGSGMMNPMMGGGMMNPMMGMMNPMMGMMNPMMGMMNPMMGMMNPMMGMMGPMSGGMGMPGMGAHGSNPMAQMPSGQMMDPKQYEQMFNQWTEMMKNMTPQTPPQANQ